MSEASSPEVSVVMPCLNEAETLAACVGKAQRALRGLDVAGENIVADNGSTDGSQAIATRMGVRLVHVEATGYGNALMGGIAAARPICGAGGTAGATSDSCLLQSTVALSLSRRPPH